MNSGAIFSADRFYRYSLFRYWNPNLPKLTYVLLNPSRADEVMDDPTVKRCVVRAFLLDFGAIEIVNLFAMRSTYPYSLVTAPDPIGPLNEISIANAIRNSKLTICGWGKNGKLRDQGEIVLNQIRFLGQIPHALKLNKDGSPQHPLYLSYKIKPFPMA